MFHSLWSYLVSEAFWLSQIRRLRHISFFFRRRLFGAFQLSRTRQNGFQKHPELPSVFTTFYLPHKAKEFGELSETLTMIRSEKERGFSKNSRSSHISPHFATPTYVLSNVHRCKNVRTSCRGSTIRKKQQHYKAHERTAWLTSFTSIHLFSWQNELDCLTQNNGHGRELASRENASNIALLLFSYRSIWLTSTTHPNKWTNSQICRLLLPESPDWQSALARCFHPIG